MRTGLRTVFIGWGAAFLLWVTPAVAQTPDLPANVWSSITALGPTLNGDMSAKSFALLRPLQASRSGFVVDKDVSYGDDPLQKIDLWRPKNKRPAPIVLFVHGGGFVGGNKNDYDNVPAYFARHGFLGVNMNYRVAPKATYPAATQDVGSVVKWLQDNAARYGGDPKRIIVIGHSAGAAIVASYVFDRTIATARNGVAAAVLISGGYVPHKGDERYYGDDLDRNVPVAHIGDGKLPLLVTMSEYDPPLLASDSPLLASALCKRDGICPPFFWLSGHNHFSQVASLDTRDDRLGRTIRDFVRRVLHE